MQSSQLKPRDLADPTINKVADSKITVRPFTGSNLDFQAFVNTAWSDAYADKMSFPVWSVDYFDWQFGGPQNPNRRLAAYAGDRLVGVLAGRSAQFQTGQSVTDGQSANSTEPITAAHYSWLSVSSSHRGHRIAPLLDEARVAHEQSLNSSLVVSYRFHGSKHSLAERPTSLHKADSVTTNPHSTTKQFNRRIGFWARPLNPTALRKWNHNRIEGWMAQLAAPLLPKVRHSQSADIRSFRTEDLAACHRLITQQQAKFAISNSWTEDSLLWQLNGHQISQTIVAEHQGVVSGFINFHVLPFQGRSRQLVGIIDLCYCDQLTPKQQRQLVNEALHRMKQQEAILALKSRTADVSSMLMLRTGFSPRPADSALVFQWMQQPQVISTSGPVQLLWR